ncbi:MAG: sigma-70 family RNA polymerase sigma factor [Synergistaceae bacterium]|nr:sigma-70 family RNA polymerase sigma factor [Synergistaceae bacterium]
MRKESEYDMERRQDDSQLWQECAAGSEEAREKLILANRPMVYWLAKKLKVPYNTYQDLIQEGMLALINAVDSFDIERNIRFSTYAYYKIHGRMVNYLQRIEAKAPIPVEEEYLNRGDSERSALYDESSRSEWSIDLENALSQLSERESDIINALVMEGRVAREFAAEKNMDVSHVYRIRRKAIARLRAWLGLEEGKSTSRA